MTVPHYPCGFGLRYVGDPVDVVTGANTDVITDLVQRGPINLLWTRYYSSARSNVHCSLGWGHAHRFDAVLIRDLDGLRYEDPNGNATGFPELDIGAWSSADGIVLTRVDRYRYYIEQEGEPYQHFQFAPAGNVAPMIWLVRNQDAIALRRDDRGRLREIIDARHRRIRVDLDNFDRVTKLVLLEPRGGSVGTTLLQYAYDGAGNLVRATDLYNTTLTFAYDAAHRMTRRTDRRGYSFHFEYDEEGRCIHSRGDDGMLEVFLTYEPTANTTFVRRGDGGQWIYSYNENKTITQITDPYGHATKFILDDRGRPVQEIDPNGNITELHYDWRGRHDYRVDPNGHALPPRSVNPDPPDPLAYRLPETALEWDFGKLVDVNRIQPPQISDRVLNGFPAPVVNTVTGKTSTYEETATSLTVLETETPITNDWGYPLSHTTPSFTERWKYDVNGRLIEHQDRDGSVVRKTYKSLNVLSELIDPLGNTVSFDYTVQRLISKVTDPRGTVTEYKYDLRDQLVEVRENGTLGESYRRDAAGNIVQKIDISGRPLVTWEIGPGNLDKVRILGSGEKHTFEHNTSGRIIKAQTPAGTATFAYDDDGTLLVDQRDGKGVVHEFELKQLVSTTYFDKFKVSYETLDNGDLLVRDPTGAHHRFQISVNGLIAKHLANGSRELCQFDSTGRCRRKALLSGVQPQVPWMRGYSYSAAGDLVLVADTHDGTTKYRYDAAHRLVEELPPQGSPRRFEHDSAGNLVAQPGLKDVLVGEGNRLNQANGETFVYNDRGHLAERRGISNTTRYMYDDLDMLVRCEINGEPWTASYDGLSRRVQKTWRGETTTYYWDDFRLAAEIRHNGTCRLYIYADHAALAPFLFIEYESVDAAPESGKRYYVFTNQIAAPIRVEDDAGQRVWSARIDPYGKTIVDPRSLVQLSLRFPGHHFDEETGLHYNLFRYFSPELGRFLQSDPVGQIAGINVYAYPRRPLIGVDIDGLGWSRKKNKGAPAGEGICQPIQGAKEMSEDELKKAMEEKTRQMLGEMKKAQEAGHDYIEIKGPDGKPQKIWVQPGYDARGPCLSLVVDKETGKVYWGQNQGTTPTGKLEEPLQTRTNERRALGVSPRNDGTPGTHSEVRATDAAMKDGAKIENTRVFNTNTYDSDLGPTPAGKSGPDPKPMTCCPNCSHITGAHNPGPQGGPDGKVGATSYTGTRDPNEGGRYTPKT